MILYFWLLIRVVDPDLNFHDLTFIIFSIYWVQSDKFVSKLGLKPTFPVISIK